MLWMFLVVKVYDVTGSEELRCCFIERCSRFVGGEVL